MLEMKKAMRLILVVSINLIDFSFVRAQEKPILAVLRLQALAVGKNETIQITNVLQKELICTGRYT